MQAAQTIGIDWPLKALVREDDMQRTWLSHNDGGIGSRSHGRGAFGGRS
jgi:hypothetical protein